VAAEERKLDLAKMESMPAADRAWFALRAKLGWSVEEDEAQCWIMGLLHGLTCDVAENCRCDDSIPWGGKWCGGCEECGDYAHGGDCSFYSDDDEDRLLVLLFRSVADLIEDSLRER